ncbi:hypothetical protein E2C01_075195 [Portunus trituberculatus]|uniref:Uncharacterized protein n=1 Tax=Portunus trituberculatus TaxID=210409 RepID=A0A5B7IA42_PORTR|nr:hypothetical protein [Portunus trituberculatus]
MSARLRLFRAKMNKGTCAMVLWRALAVRRSVASDAAGTSPPTIDNPRCQSPLLFDTREADNDTGEVLVAWWRALTRRFSIRVQARRSQLILALRRQSLQLCSCP